MTDGAIEPGLGGGPASVTEVVMRDGLQDLDMVVPTGQKLEIVDALIEAGLRTIEIGAFVSAKRVPQMADTSELLARVPRRAGVRYGALVFNRLGAQQALDAGVDEVRLVVSASEAHSRANAGRSVEEALGHCLDAMEVLVRSAGAPSVIASIATAFVCPWEGRIDSGRVVRLVSAFADAGVETVYLADTLGAADPMLLRRSIEAVRSQVPDVRLGLHLHDTHGMAVACAWEAIGLGVRAFDAALGGFGGCPFAPGAEGNVATEDLVGLLESVGVSTGVDLDKALLACGVLEEVTGSRSRARRRRAAAARSAP